MRGVGLGPVVFGPVVTQSFGEDGLGYATCCLEASGLSWWGAPRCRGLRSGLETIMGLGDVVPSKAGQAWVGSVLLMYGNDYLGHGGVVLTHPEYGWLR